MEKIELKKGDIIYSSSRSSFIGKHTITRVTKTMAISGLGYRFKRYCFPNHIEKVSRGSFETTSYRLQTEELRREYRKFSLINKIKSIDLNTLSDEKIEQVFKIVYP